MSISKLSLWISLALLSLSLVSGIILLCVTPNTPIDSAYFRSQTSVLLIIGYFSLIYPVFKFLGLLFKKHLWPLWVIIAIIMISLFMLSPTGIFVVAIILAFYIPSLLFSASYYAIHWPIVIQEESFDSTSKAIVYQLDHSHKPIIGPTKLDEVTGEYIIAIKKNNKRLRVIYRQGINSPKCKIPPIIKWNGLNVLNIKALDGMKQIQLDSLDHILTDPDHIIKDHKLEKIGWTYCK